MNWISIEDQIPGYNVVVLLYMKGRVPVIGYLTSTDVRGHHFLTEHDGEDLIEAPTHWMPLPEKPE